MPHIENPALLLALVIAAGVALQWLAWWLHLPAILLLLAAGIVAGPLTGVIDPDRTLGNLLFPLVSLGVAVILFEGSLTLRWHEIHGVERVVRNLVSVGALVTWLTIGAACHWLVKLPTELALLFGALVVVTGPTVIVPLLRSVRPVQHVAAILRWEGIIVDPVGALLAVLVFEFILSGRHGHTLWLFAAAVAAGGGGGVVGGWVLAQLLRRHFIPDYLQNAAALALVLAVFVATNAVVPESGLLAVTVMGILLANLRDIPTEGILDFKETLSVLLISVFFILLAARMDLQSFAALGWNAAALFAVVVFVARPLAVAVSAFGSELSWSERLLLAWIAPRGIVAAAISALFAIRLQQLGFPGADLVVTLTFMVIIGTVVLQSATARPLALWLGVAEPAARGVMLVGGDRVARAIGKVLHDQGLPVLVADTSWENIRESRMLGLRTYFGNAVSEHADRRLDLVGIGHLLAMSQRPAFNALACLRYRSEFGAGNVYALKMPEEKDASEKMVFATRFRPARLFGEDVTYTKLASLLSKGYEIRVTRLSETFDFEAYGARYGKDGIPLFALDRAACLHVFSEERAVSPESGWVVLGLVPPEETLSPETPATPGSD